jgi:soluble lytic murein transglycosylase-like protein
MDRIRTGVVIAGYLLWVIIAAFGTMHSVPPPPSIKVVAPTEAQIKEQVIRERHDREIARRVERAIVTARAVYREVGCQRDERDGLSVLTGRTAYEYGISARLLAAVVYVESSCNPRAVSGKDSIGLLQVNPKVWGHRDQLTDPEFNIHLGAKILAGYIRHYGLVEGLHHYNGLGDPSDAYARRVLAVGKIEWPS